MSTDRYLGALCERYGADPSEVLTTCQQLACKQAGNLRASKQVAWSRAEMSAAVATVVARHDGGQS